MLLFSVLPLSMFPSFSPCSLATHPSLFLTCLCCPMFFFYSSWIIHGLTSLFLSCRVFLTAVVPRRELRSFCRSRRHHHILPQWVNDDCKPNTVPVPQCSSNFGSFIHKYYSFLCKSKLLFKIILLSYTMLYTIVYRFQSFSPYFLKFHSPNAMLLLKF